MQSEHDTISNWRSCVAGSSAAHADTGTPHLVSILEGEGIGPDLLAASHRLLTTIAHECGVRFDIRLGRDHDIGLADGYATPLSPSLVEFCQTAFARGGAILAGPGGGRFVYDLRKRFDLFCKIVPVQPCAALQEAGRLRSKFLENVDILIVRENASGIYFGEHVQKTGDDGDRRIEYTFSYSEHEVRRVVSVAAKLALQRRGHLTVVTKEGGLPAIGDLWKRCGQEIGRSVGVEVDVINIDYAAYYLVQHAQALDVVVSSNLLGDILADVSATLLGTRGLSFSANYAASGASVYQTNHGGAQDLVGKDEANPVAQFLTTAMMLRESFGLAEEARLIEDAVAEVYREGWRTRDLDAAGGRVVGTAEMVDLVIDAMTRRCRSNALR
jgi:3-isopropylmalate dehydrogenase